MGGATFATYVDAARFVQLSAKADTNVTPTFVRPAELALIRVQVGAGNDDLA